MKQKWRRRIFYYGITAAVLAVMLVGNLLLAFCAQAFHLHVDLTDESLYTMSDDFITELGRTKGDVTIIFCAEPDILLSDETTRIVYYMAVEMSLKFDRFHVETVDIERNPGAVAAYKTTSATTFNWDSIIIASDTGYKIRDAASFWLYTEDGTSAWSYNGEYEMASAILSLLSVEKPKVCITYGHGEAMPDAARMRAFYQLIPDKLNAELVFIDLDTQEIPKDCVLLIMDGPTEDYVGNPLNYEDYQSGYDNVGDYYGYVSPTEKIERYLDNFGAFFVLKDPFVKLPVLEDFLETWGITFTDTLIKDSTIASSNRTRLVASYADAEKHALGHSLYSAIASLATAPSAIVENTGAIQTPWEDNYRYFSSAYTALYSPVLLSPNSAQAYNAKDELVNRDGDYHLVSIVNRSYFEPETGNSQYAYIMAAATTAIIDDAYMTDKAYANPEVIFAALRTMSSTKNFAAMDVTINSENYGGKILINHDIYSKDTEVFIYGTFDSEGNIVIKQVAGLGEGVRLAYTVVLLALPTVAVAGFGAWCYVRRRHL